MECTSSQSTIGVLTRGDKIITGQAFEAQCLYQWVVTAANPLGMSCRKFRRLDERLRRILAGAVRVVRRSFSQIMRRRRATRCDEIVTAGFTLHSERALGGALAPVKSRISMSPSDVLDVVSAPFTGRDSAVFPSWDSRSSGACLGTFKGSNGRRIIPAKAESPVFIASARCPSSITHF